VGTTDDDDPAADWAPRPNDDTSVDLNENDLRELDETSPTPPRGVETLAGYEAGCWAARAALFAELDDLMAEQRHRGRAEVLHAVRDHMLDDGAPPAIADAIIAALAARAGVKLG
jgi:hypothetical protein